ncbi:MAG TPA: prolyl oligopeptidase family serine peptidase [Puia sp.]|nr:prolyl oligopeptidase family serine peptidase [Puia sp.]
MRKLLLLLLAPLAALGQPSPSEIVTGLLPFKKYPFPTELTAAATGSRIAWAMNEEGRRNVYVAEGPDFTPRKLTAYTLDDGQEITSLMFSDDGQWVVFVRGGDHGANWDDELPVDPGGATEPFKVQVGVIPFGGGTVRYLSEGDEPAISPDSKRVVFIKNGQAWVAALDSAAGDGKSAGGAAAGEEAKPAAKNLFTTRGTVSSLQWSPDGKRLLFVAGRVDHSVIGIYTVGSSTIRWIAPSFSRNESPKWSVDGSRIVFVRRPGMGGAPDSMLVRRPAPWSIYTVDTAGDQPTLLYKAPNTLRGSYPGDEGSNLQWATGNNIVFLSYEDGWQHLYSIPADGGRPVLLTPGNFMCEQVRISADKRFLVFSANTGTEPDDIDRRHIGTVSVDQPDLRIVTPGKGLEWTPVVTGDGKTLAFLSATAQRPPLPAVMDLGNEPTGRSIDGAGGTGVAGTRGTGAGTSAWRLLCEDKIADYPVGKLVTPKQVIFTSPDGVVVHAQLFMPPGDGPAGKLGGPVSGGPASGRRPAIVYLHGGPPRQMLLGWHYSDYYANAYASNQYLASLGFVVLSVNYRLGIGYGYEFHQAPKSGQAGAAEYTDVKAGGEWLRRQSFVDGGRIGIYGGSYGGYLTAMGLARDSKLFAAGVDFHGVHDMLAARGLAGLRDRYEKAPDYDLALKTAWLSSPVAYVSGWKSPVLIIQGDDDRNVRFNQSVDLVNRLEKQGVPYETLMIVDDTHHWMRFANAVTVYGSAADFFVRKFMRGETR